MQSAGQSGGLKRVALAGVCGYRATNFGCRYWYYLQGEDRTVGMPKRSLTPRMKRDAFEFVPPDTDSPKSKTENGI